MIHLFDKMKNCIDVHGFDFLVVYNILKRSVSLYSVVYIALHHCTGVQYWALFSLSVLSLRMSPVEGGHKISLSVITRHRVPLQGQCPS